MNKELNEYAETIDKFADELHRLAEYMRTNPDKHKLTKMQDIYLEILPVNIELLKVYKNKYPDVFKFMITKNK